MTEESPLKIIKDRLEAEGYSGLYWASTCGCEIDDLAPCGMSECGRCGKFKYPQELSAFIDRVTARRGKKTVVAESAVCNECEEKGVAK